MGIIYWLKGGKKNKIIIFCFLFLLFAEATIANTAVNGIQSGLWSVKESPFVVTDDIIIPKGLTLTIEPGVIVKFNGPWRFIVAGALIARGTAASRIIFTSQHDSDFVKDTETYHQSLQWYGIDFTDSSDDYLNIIDRCIIRYCKFGIRCRNAYPLLSHIIFANIANKFLAINNTNTVIQPGVDTDYLTIDQRPTIKPIPEPQPETAEELQQRLKKEKLTALQEAREDSIRIANKIKPGDTKCGVLVFDEQDMMHLGFDSFPELLSFLPGFINIYSLGEGSFVTCRGVFPGQFNNRMLLLLNGIPVYDGITNSNFFDFIPINTIEKIVVYRGPDGAYWGKNGFAGVVNFITKQTTQQVQMNTSSEIGSYRTKKITSYLGLNFGATNLCIGTSYRDDNGYWRTVNTDESGNSFRLNYEYDNYNFLIVSNSRELNLVGSYFKQDRYQFGVIPIQQHGGLAEREGLLINANYTKELNQNLSGKLSVRYNYTSLQNETDEFGTIQTNTNLSNFTISRSNLFQTELKINYLAPQYPTSFGISIEKGKANHVLTLLDNKDGNIINKGSKNPEPELTEFSVFVLSKYNFSPFIGCVGGLRWSNLGKGSEYFTSPSIKLIYNPFAPFHVQLSYQHGYRSPTLWERQILIQDLLYSPSNLMPEQIRSGEITLDYFNLSLGQFGICGYWEEISNLIIQRQLTDDEKIEYRASTGYLFDNSKLKHEITGCEINYQGKIFNDLSILINGAYQQFIDDVINKPYWPNIVGNLGFNYRYHAKISCSINLQYIGEQTSSQSENTLKPCYFLNFKIGTNLLSNVILELISHNLLNATCLYREFNRRNIPLVPGGYPRAFFLLIKTEF